MNFHIAICLCLLLSTGVFSKTTRVIGGAPASISDFSFMVTIRNLISNRLICAGTIVSHWNILTAAHCLYGFDDNFANVKVYAGTVSSVNTNVSSYEIENVHFHPQFNFLNLNGVYTHDIAVVKLRTSIQFNAVQNKIALPSRRAHPDNMAIIVGWGMTESSTTYTFSPILRVALGIILKNYECSSRLQHPIGEYQLCTIGVYGTGFCMNDAGGAVISNGELYGVISYVVNRVEGLPDAHTKVHYYLDFIKNLITE